jgi:hypothetical protein
MSDEPDNLILRYLRRLDGRSERTADDLSDIKKRLTPLEQQITLLHGGFSGQSVRIDRIDIRLERIERRLDLIDHPA